MAPAVAFAENEEFAAVIDPGNAWIGIHPRTVFVDEDGARSAGGGIGQQKLNFVLKAIHVLQQHVGGIRPLHSGDVEIMRVSPRLHPGDVSARDTNYTHAHSGVLRSGKGIGILQRLGIHAETRIRKSGDDFAPRSTEIVDQRVGLHSAVLNCQKAIARLSGLQAKPSRMSSSSSFTQSEVPSMTVGEPSRVSCAIFPLARSSA